MSILDSFDFSKISIPKMDFPSIQIAEMPMIDPEDTVVGQIKREIKEQNNLVSQQLATLSEQNRLLEENYNKLKDLYDMQEKNYLDAREDLKKSSNFNRWMMVIAVIAMLAAIAGPIVTILLSK